MFKEKLTVPIKTSQNTNDSNSRIQLQNKLSIQYSRGHSVSDQRADDDNYRLNKEQRKHKTFDKIERKS